MRDLWLHVGLHKTGTSHLQTLLLENRDLLARSGTGMGPHQHPETGGHHPLLEAVDRDGAAAVFDQAAELPGERLVISAEDLCLRLEDAEFARALQAAAARHFRPRILIFLRRQDYLRESLYAEAAKFYAVGDITRPTEQVRYFEDHDARLRALETVFGPENVTVRIYRDDAPGTGAPNDILKDFFDAVDPGVDPALLRQGARRNVSLPRRRVLFQAQLPWAVLPDGEPRNLGLCRLLTRVLSTTGAIADDGVRCLAPPEARRAIVAPFLDGNRALVARHAIADPGEFTALPALDAAWTPPAPVSPGEAMAVLRECLSVCRRDFGPVRAARLSLELIRVFADWRLRGPAPGTGGGSGRG